jgi:CHAD domain-containing protein
VAGARKVKLDCEGTFSKAAAKAVRVRSKEVFAHSEGALDLDRVERVHDMRVATRRLRAALEIFEPCFPAKRHRKALKRIKALADALGERRDADVEIAMLERLAGDAAEADRAAVRRLTEECRARQREANDELAAYVAPKRLRKLRKRLVKLAKAAGS